MDNQHLVDLLERVAKEDWDYWMKMTRKAPIDSQDDFETVASDRFYKFELVIEAVKKYLKIEDE